MPLILAFIAAIFLLRGNYFTPPADFVADLGQSVCAPVLEPNQTINVDVDDTKLTLPDGTPLYVEKGGKTWVLMKRNASVPAWKAQGGAPKCRFNNPDYQEKTRIMQIKQIPACQTYIANANLDVPEACRAPVIEWRSFCEANDGTWLSLEMEKIGTVANSTAPNLLNRDVYIGLGHCDGVPSRDSNCTNPDPLVQDALFVPVPGGEGIQRDANGWWPANAQCLNQFETQITDECQALPGYWWYFNVYIDSSLLPANNADTDDLPCWTRLACTGDNTVDGYRRRNAMMDEFLRTGVCPVNTSPDVLAATAGPTPTGAADNSSSTNQTLQLGSFLPNHFAYEWWTPSCKPAIYLYPEKPTALSVEVSPQGYISQSIPNYGQKGWQAVMAYPDGTLNYQQTSYPYLYYEAVIHNLTVPKNGWIVRREDLKTFFATTLPRLGLNSREQQDFISYWLPKLTSGEKWFITLIPREELDKVEAIKFSETPATFIRVRFYFEDLTLSGFGKNLSAEVNLQPPVLPPTVSRSGFTAVDWGGILSNGSCGLTETSK